jgi:hypothetical protein
MFGFSYVTQGTKDYRPYIKYGIWFAENKDRAIAQIQMSNQANEVQTNVIDVYIIDNLPDDVRVENGRLVR